MPKLKIFRSFTFAAVLLGQPVLAQDAHLAEYARYQTAFDKGDVGAAMAYAKAAWQAAETELPDAATTAVLAYNYARLASVYAETSALARQAYTRTLELSEKGLANFRPDDIRIALAELTVLHEPKLEATSELSQLLWERRKADAAPTELSAHAWKSLATENLRQLDRMKAAIHADFAAIEAETLQPIDVELATEAYMLSAVARLSDHHCASNHVQISAAIRGLDRTIALSSPLLANQQMAQRQATAIEWRESAQGLATKLRRARSQGDAKYWPRD